MNTIKDLTGQYQLSKTLRFELKPIGKTREHMEEKGIISNDKQRAEEYKLMKEIIDRFHKKFIAESMGDLELKLESSSDLDSLKEYEQLLSIPKSNLTESDVKNLEKVRTRLRQQIVKKFETHSIYKGLFSQDLIKKHIQEFVTGRDLDVVRHFENFTSYFVGFHDNRKNIYTDKEQSTAIAYRLIHENFPRFLDNIRSFKIIADSDVKHELAKLSASMEVSNVRDFFTLEHFSRTLTQDGIALYNTVIGGKTNSEGIKIQGLNEYINLYNQTHNDTRLPLLKPLYKMILSDKVSLSWLPESFNSDEEMINAINEMHKSLYEVLYGEDESSLCNLLGNIRQYDTTRIYISNDLGLTNISQHIFGQYDIFTRALKEDLCSANSKKRKESDESYQKRISDLLKKIPSIPLSTLNKIAEKNQKSIIEYFEKAGAYSNDGQQKVNLFTQIEMAFIGAKEILSGKHGNINQSDDETARIKNLLDSYKAVQHFISPLLATNEEFDKDTIFDGYLRRIWDELAIVTPLYNKVRNWLTRKPYSTEKVKLNFENVQLLGGWTLSKERDYATIILRQENVYYLGIMDDRSVFLEKNIQEDNDCYYEKMEYRFFKDITTMIPKCSTQMKSVKDHFKDSTDDYVLTKGFRTPLTITKEIFDLNNPGNDKVKQFQVEYLKSTNDRAGFEHALYTWMRFCLNFLNSYENTADFDLSSLPDISTYTKLDSFYSDVNTLLYSISFRKVSKRYVDSLVESGKLYLFKIWNKDFSEHSKGTPNMHTLYWKMLFNEKNLSNVVYKLNGEAEMFYRKGSIDSERNTIHPAGIPIKNKNILNTKKTSVFNYDIVKDRRYTVDKFQLHVPITINFKASNIDNVNDSVRDIIRKEGIKHVIGIDRGERHLLYLCLIDLKGNIVKQMSLNDIKNEYNGQQVTINYKNILAARESERLESRQAWKKIENIKDIKAGYLSQVVHVITRMMVEYDAIVVLEDLNFGFMKGRQKIEKNVYEQFEHALIDKLNYYVDKQRKIDEPGGLLKALQLANKFISFQKLGKQSGCLFYVPAWNTSKIDPVTGFVNLLDTRYESVDKSREFFFKFDKISYNQDKDLFEFSFDYSKFSRSIEGTKMQWTICSHGTRIETFRNSQKNNQWDSREVNLTSEIKKVLSESGIDYKNDNLKDGICRITDRKTLEALMRLMRLMLQMRNSVTGTDIDYLISPVSNNGQFYDSRTADNNLPKDADANGAYNIARKGLCVIEKIKASESRDKVDLTISNREWLVYAQK